MSTRVPFADCTPEFYIEDDGLSVGADIYGPDGTLVDRVERLMVSDDDEMTVEDVAARLPQLNLILKLRIALRGRT